MKLCIKFFILTFWGIYSFELFSQDHTLCIKGVVTYIYDNQNLLNGDIVVGDSLKGNITYNLNSPDSNPNPPIAHYYSNNIPSGIYVTIDNHSFQTDSTDVNFLLEVNNDYIGRDNITIHSYNNRYYPTIPGLSYGKEISWQLDDTNMTAVSNTNIFRFINLNSWQQPVALVISGNNYFQDTSIFIRALVTQVDSCGYLNFIEDLSLSQNIKIYPNPVSDNTTFIIQSDKVNKTYSFELIDVLGKQVILINEIKGNQFKISKDNLPNGIYFYKIYTAGNIFGTGKLMIVD